VHLLQRRDNFALQYPVILSALRKEQDQETILRKIRVTAAFLDILIHRRILELASHRLLDHAILHLVTGATPGFPASSGPAAMARGRR
jgi:hypothetical protein